MYITQCVYRGWMDQVLLDYPNRAFTIIEYGQVFRYAGALLGSNGTYPFKVELWNSICRYHLSYHNGVDI